MWGKSLVRRANLVNFCVCLASDANEEQLWVGQLQTCARRHSDSSAKVTHTHTHAGGDAHANKHMHA